MDAASRTLKVRLEADNPGYVLRPDMFVDVELPVALRPALVVPAGALLDSGLRKTVFVERAEGVFEPREVETGWHFGDKVEIVSGLAAGERIVVSGTFLLDSESRMQSAAARSGAARRVTDPICGMRVDEDRSRSGGLTSQYEGRTFHFCSMDCKHRFDTDAARRAAIASRAGSERAIEPPGRPRP